jgi:transforming growth factor-beta-induced protein
MKHLLWMGAVLIAAQSLVACGDDDDDNGNTGGKGGAAGSAVVDGGEPSTGGKPSDGGKPSTGGSDKGGEAPTPGTGGTGGDGETALKDIVDTAVDAGSFTSLAEALTTADLVDALKGEGPFTVFAPDDDAFEAFDKANEGVLAGLDKDALTAILKYHVVAGAAKSTDLKNGQVFVTLNGSPLLVDLTDGVNVGNQDSNANVKAADVEASNGVIHVIDTIILPPENDIVETAIAAGVFKKLAAALTTADLVTALQGDGPFTVFAPTDDAFDKLGSAAPTDPDVLKDVLLYHVVNRAVGSGDLVAGEVETLLEDKSVTIDLDDGVKVNNATVGPANIIAKNGVIHVVDTVLVPE